MLKHWGPFTLQFWMRWIAMCFVPLGTCLWHVAHGLMNLVTAAERLIRFGLDRRRSTQGNDGNLVESISGCSRMARGTCHWHVPYNLTKSPLQSKLVARSRRGKQHSICFYERKTIRSLVLRFAKGDLDTYIKFVGSNSGKFSYVFLMETQIKSTILAQGNA